MTQRPARVLLVDDDFQLLRSLSRGLSLKGFDVEACPSPGEAVGSLERAWPDVVLLDVAMPGMDGMTFCRLIRGRSNVPILMLTARDAVQDRVAGLDSGADDYLVKPFDLSELIARIHSLLRRSSGEAVAPSVLSYAGLRLNRSAWEAEQDSRPLDLTSIEFLILAALMAAPGVVLSRETLLKEAWGSPDGASSNVVDVHVANLRKKVEADGRRRIIQTVRGAGYKLQAD